MFVKTLCYVFLSQNCVFCHPLRHPPFPTVISCVYTIHVSATLPFFQFLRYPKLFSTSGIPKCGVLSEVLFFSHCPDNPALPLGSRVDIITPNLRKSSLLSSPVAVFFSFSKTLCIIRNYQCTYLFTSCLHRQEWTLGWQRQWVEHHVFGAWTRVYTG